MDEAGQHGEVSRLPSPNHSGCVVLQTSLDEVRGCMSHLVWEGLWMEEWMAGWMNGWVDGTAVKHIN